MQPIRMSMTVNGSGGVSRIKCSYVTIQKSTNVASAYKMSNKFFMLVEYYVIVIESLFDFLVVVLAEKAVDDRHEFGCTACQLVATQVHSQVVVVE